MAKDIHDDLEALYIEAMDFGKIAVIADGLTERIWQSEWWSE